MAAVCSKASDVTFFVKVTVRTVVRPSGSTACTRMVCVPFRIFRHSSAENVSVFAWPSVTAYVRRAEPSSVSVTVTVPPWASVTVYW